MIRFILNEKEIATALPPGLVLLDFIRYHQHLMGTKIGCREGDCGACTVLTGELKNDSIIYQSVTSCLMPIGNAAGKHIVTVEGVNPGPENGPKQGQELNAVQQAMADAGATQCGFCTPGFVMSLAGFCLSDTAATRENAIAAIDGNICRCTGYKSIERAAAIVADIMKSRNAEEPASFVSKQKILPAYFASMKSRLQLLKSNILAVTSMEQNATGLQSPAHNSRLSTQIIAGGTDLYVQKHDEMVTAESSLVYDHPTLKGITTDGNWCIIGAAATATDLQHSAIINKAFPNFQRYTKLISSTPIRNMATIGGNFINASPIGDFTIFFLALDAQVDLRSTALTSEISGSSKEKFFRTIPLRELFAGYKQLNKTPNEYIQSIRFELPGKNNVFNFEKVSKRMHLDIATVNSAISLNMQDDIIESAGISAGGVAPVPMFLQKTSEFLKGKALTEGLVYEVIAIAQTEISPISDARGTKEYKRKLLGQLIKAHFITLFNKLNVQSILIR